MNKKKVKFNIDLFSSPSIVSSIDTPKNDEKPEININEYGIINIPTKQSSFTAEVKKVSLTKKKPKKKLLFSCATDSPVKKKQK